MSRRESPSVTDAIAIDASFRAGKVAARKSPRTRVAFDPAGKVQTQREGIPPTGMVDGKEYRDASVEVTVRGHLHDELRRAERDR